MVAFATGAKPESFHSTRYYATTKVFTSWWSAAIAHGIGGPYTNGKTYTSRPKKLIGPLHEMTHPHLLDVERQEAAWTVLNELAGTEDHQASQRAAAE